MIKKSLIVICSVAALALVTILVLASFKPDTFQIVRSVDIKAPPEKIYPFVADFRKWAGWSPFENLGPMSRHYSGAESGLGAKYAWDGEKPGAGSMEIVHAEEPKHIELRLDFTRPFDANNRVDFTFAPKGDVTPVTWDMHGPLPYMFKIFHVVMDTDAMVGKDFESGLAALKALSEK